MMKLTDSQKETLRRSSLLSQVVRDKLENLERLKRHVAAHAISHISKSDPNYKVSYDQWQLGQNFARFVDALHVPIQQPKSKYRGILIHALADFQYEGIEGKEGDALVGIVTAATYDKKGTIEPILILDYIINQSFEEFMLQPEAI